MRQAALVTQLHALVDPEAVLFVDDRKRQLVKLDAGLEQGVGAHRDEIPAFPYRFQPRPPFRRALPAGEQPHVDAEWGQPTAQGLEMLFRKNLGGGHDGGLAASLGGPDRGEGGDHRLAGADVALQEAHHGPLVRQILEYFGGRLGLGPGQPETELLEQLPPESRPGGKGDGGLALERAWRRFMTR